MKRFLTIIVAACAFFAASAQNPMVTLSHNGELSFFTNLTALEAAIDSAQNGDIIYLSEGNFIVNGGSLTIKKRLSIVGSGYNSHILGNIEINMTSNENSAIDEPWFDGVRLDQLSFYSNSPALNNLQESEIRNCWIRTLKNGAYAGKNVTYDKCYIEEANFPGNGTVMVKNSKIGGSKRASNDAMYQITAINCHIVHPYYYPLTMVSCVLMNNGNAQPSVYSSSASAINTVFDFNPTSTNLYTHNCYNYSDESQPLLDDNFECSLNLEELGYLGQDGTVAGIKGGESPFSENPSVPIVDSSKSSVEYDAENNKLKVSISVNAD